MSKLLVFTLGVLFCVININADTKGYYWRNLFKTLPEDALPAGKTSTGEDTYVGQIVPKDCKASLFPGAYVPSEGVVFYESEKKQFTTDKFIKILCTKEKDKFVWIKVTKGESVNRPDDLLYVLGGQHLGYPVAIGRTQTDNNVAQGGVVVIDDKFQELHYDKGKTGYVIDDYEVLFYKKH